jgi:hypothetical protein
MCRSIDVLRRGPLASVFTLFILRAIGIRCADRKSNHQFDAVSEVRSNDVPPESDPVVRARVAMAEDEEGDNVRTRAAEIGR